MDPTSKEGKAKAKTYRDITPDWLETILDFAVGAPEDPNTMLQVGMPTPMVSAYAKFFGGEGAKAARMAGTQGAIDAVRKAGAVIGAPQEHIDMAVEFFNKYPRIAAHSAVEAAEKVPGHQSAHAGYSPSGQGMGKITLTKGSKNNFTEDVIHETMHGAQNIGMKEQSGNIYRDASNALGGPEQGYLPNPMERAARNAVDTRVPITGGPLRLDVRARRAAGVRPTPPLLDMLKQIGVVDPNIPNTDFMGTIKRMLGGS